jgi:hypothetical protein
MKKYFLYYFVACLSLFSLTGCTQGQKTDKPGADSDMLRKKAVSEAVRELKNARERGEKRRLEFLTRVEELNRKNPFEFASKEYGSLTLNGIIMDKENPVAIIGEEVYSVGDEVGGKTVKSITKSEVVFEEKNGNVFTLSIGKE